MNEKQVTKAVFAAYDERTEDEAVAPDLEFLEPVAPDSDEPQRKSPRMPDAEIDPGAADVIERMLRAGASREFAEQVTGYVHRKGLRGAFAIDGAAEVLGKLFQRSGSPKRGTGAARVAFFGPTGAGKTACIAKLGRRLADSGRAVAFASLDPLGLANLERISSLEEDRDRTEIPLAPVSDAAELDALLAEHDDIDLVLIDTPGISPGDERGLQALEAQLNELARAEPLDGYLVLAANLEASAVEFAVSAFSALSPTAAVLTKIDETRAPGAALEALYRRRLPIAFLTDGQDVRRHLMRPRPADFADLFLRGKVTA